MGQINTMNTLRQTVRLLVLLAFVALFAWGCAQKQAIKSVDMLSTPNLLMEADTAWQAKRFEATELYYATALERQDLVRSKLPTIYARLAESAYTNEIGRAHV